MASTASAIVPVPSAADELRADEACRPVHAGDAEPVAADGADRARHMRAVVVVIHRIARARDRVEAMTSGGADDRGAADRHRERRRRRPDVGREVGMGVVDARVDHRHDVRAASGRDIPRSGGADVGASSAGGAAVHGLPDVLESPQASGSSGSFGRPANLTM